MTVRTRIAATSGARRRIARRSVVLMSLLVCLLLIPAATAHADVMAKYRAKYKNKLTYYRNHMDAESDTFYVAWKQAVESTSNLLTIALADTEHPENAKLIEQSALDQRDLLQDATATTRDHMYADIAAFKAKAVNWFKTSADRKRFKARIATMRSGFVQIFSADESLMSAFYYLGVNADVAGCANEVMAGDMTRTTAETTFDNGLKQLRALQ